MSLVFLFNILLLGNNIPKVNFKLTNLYKNNIYTLI